MNILDATLKIETIAHDSVDMAHRAMRPIHWRWLLKLAFAISLLASMDQSSYDNEYGFVSRILDPMMDHQLEDAW